MGSAWSWGVPGLGRSAPKGGCLLGGVPALGGCLLWGGACSGGVPALGGACSGGVTGGDPPMATAAGGTHPTGMHSCVAEIFCFHFVKHLMAILTLWPTLFI